VDDLLVFFAQNTLGALILALCVSGVTRVWRSPAVVHVLWLLVLIKLIAPPLVGVDGKTVTRWVRSTAPVQTATNPPAWQVVDDRVSAFGAAGELSPPRLLPQTFSNVKRAQPPLGPGSALVTTAERHAPDLAFAWQRISHVLFWIWLGGAAFFATVATIRVARFYSRLRYTLPASERLQSLGRGIAARFGVRRPPDIRYVETGGPLVCCLGRRPVILLPIGLFRQLDDEQASMILAHEMAHLCRRDHWVRLFELVVSVVYWWNPLVWFVRRPLHAAEEQCCDAWVRWAFPDSAKRYAELVLQAADAIKFQTDGQPLLASSFLRRHSLKARIEMILQSRFAPRLSPRGKALLCLLALVALPLFVQSAKSHAQQPSDFAQQAIEAASTPRLPPVAFKPNALRAAFEAKFPHVPEHPSDADFPQIVHFERGASKLQEGDKIDITEVRGTATTMSPGDVYWIKGTYTLASHDRASLTINVTAASASDGWGPSLKTQSVDVTKGSGTFTLLYAMICKGWPHVSFYPKGNGGDFGGTYFGTGEFVLRKWWGEGKTEAQQDHAEVAPPKASATDFPYVVGFELGETRFLPGDNITITEVRGTDDKIALGEIYCVKGHYTLASHDRAQLNLGISARDAADGRRNGFRSQDSFASKGAGTFTLFLPMVYKGWPHISFYPAEGGNGFGGVYFGTGDSVWNRASDVAPHTTAQDGQLEGPEPKLIPTGVPLSQRLWDDLGLRFKPNSLALGEDLLPYERALFVTEVRPGSPAAKSSIHVNDGLIAIDRHAMWNSRNVLWVLNHRREGNANDTRLQFLIVRDALVHQIEVTIPPKH
jgi:beta-lactamase regulating signal transducer with metallopeptidase domain